MFLYFFFYYLVIPEEVKPKFVKGSKRYGRRTHPEREAVENEANKYLHDQDQRKSQLRRSSSLESVEVGMIHCQKIHKFKMQ